MRKHLLALREKINALYDDCLNLRGRERLLDLLCLVNVALADLDEQEKKVA